MFSNTNFNRFKILFVFDCDATTEFQYCKERKTEYLEPYIFKNNVNNTLPEVERGIENLFDDEVFVDEEKYFSVIETKRDGVVQSKVRKLRKSEFSDYITDEMNSEDTFYLFEEVQNLIRDKFSE